MDSYRYPLSNNKCTTEGANYQPNSPLFQIGGNAMNKNEFFEAVKNGVLENLKKTDDTLEATINKVTKINNVIYTGLAPATKWNVLQLIDCSPLRSTPITEASSLLWAACCSCLNSFPVK